MTAKIKDDTAPQQRLCPEYTLKFMNFNRRMPMLSAVKDPTGELHKLIVGEENLSMYYIEDTGTFDEASLEEIRSTIQKFQKDNELDFNIKSKANHIVLVVLPKTITAELIEVITKKISYSVPTLFIPNNIKSTFKLQGTCIVLPEQQIMPDLQSPTVVNWDAFVRLVQYLDEHENWKELHKVSSVGRFSVPIADHALIKMDIE